MGGSAACDAGLVQATGKTITLIVPTLAGGGPNTVARLLAAPLGKIPGSSAVVEQLWRVQRPAPPDLQARTAVGIKRVTNFKPV